MHRRRPTAAPSLLWTTAPILNVIPISVVLIDRRPVIAVSLVGGEKLSQGLMAHRGRRAPTANPRTSDSGAPATGSHSGVVEPRIDARTVAYRCLDGSSNTIVVEMGSSDELAGVLNGIDLCEFDGGLIEVEMEVPCSQGLRTITVPVNDNTVTEQSVIDACELVS